MNLIWLKSSAGDEAGHRIPGEQTLPMNPEDCTPGAMQQGNPAGTVVEVRNDDDLVRALELAADPGTPRPIWVYQPTATIESTEACVKAGISRVFRDLDTLEREIDSLHSRRSAESGSHRTLVGGSGAMNSLLSNIELVANRRCNVLIEGETGTGKEVVAREIHCSGSRSRGPWVAVNCGAIPETLLEAELFGHVKGAFTGAVQGRIGKFEAANHGTIFLDEIGDMPFAVQAKLLRVLQEKEVERLGGNERIRLDVRIIAATNVDLQDRVRAGLFRQDLYYRLNVFQINLPPLRERSGDIPALARHLVAKICSGEGLKLKHLDDSALRQLAQHGWPGNVRELENVLEMAIILSGTRSNILATDIRISTGISSSNAPDKSFPERTPGVSIPSGGLDYQQALETFEHDLLTQALTRTRGNKTAAAELLRLKRTTLSARMRVLESRMPRLVA